MTMKVRRWFNYTLPDNNEFKQIVEPRPRLVSQVVMKSSQVEVSIKNNVQAERRRQVLQSAAHKKMIISVVNNTYEGGGGRRF